ncbi:prephenate dehydratase [Oecophyllibacter saccharovorans]|uniref:prephenate dehydratase n=1 Tax=Oecophyllibacter saccharovorans TaxID=2558360 RepID=UPI00116C9F31|nr:prephenate dehydratase [Oecophyllibacter saccharovorans]TPW36773.1 prephenate dehydratase [Oecophyllibacter saccharovorans]
MAVIAFQGRPGAYSDLACREARPGWQTLPCRSFAETIQAVARGEADEALLPCENSLAGRVPEIHALLPESGLVIVGEHFQRIEHCLLVLPGTRLEELRCVNTHPVALAQVRDFLARTELEGVAAFDTAGAAEEVAQRGDRTQGAIASALAGTLNGLTVLERNIEDASHNTTRFYRVARAARAADLPAGQAREQQSVGFMTTLLVRGRNSPGALYRILGCFVRHGVNMTRIESYMLDGSFTATRFLMDVEGAPDEAALAQALAELAEVSEAQRILGVYPRTTEWRDRQGAQGLQTEQASLLSREWEEGKTE